MMLAMLTGGIDLSLVATANLAAITMSTVYTAVAAGNPGLAEQSFPLILTGGSPWGYRWLHQRTADFRRGNHPYSCDPGYYADFQWNCCCVDGR